MATIPVNGKNVKPSTLTPQPPQGWGGGIGTPLSQTNPIPAILKPPGTNTPGIPQPLPNQNPWGGASGGGGGGGGGGSGLTQDQINQILGLIPGAQPKPGTWNNINLPEYNAPEFYKWDNSAYTGATGSVNEGIAAGLASGSKDFDVAGAQLAQYQNPFGDVRTTNPGNEAMDRMLRSQGVGTGAADQTAQEGQYLDAGFGFTQNLLAGAADQRQAGNLRGLAGDRRHFRETLEGEQRAMNAQIQAAEAKAKTQYDKDLFMYGKAEADKNFEINMAEATANAQGKQGMQDSNLASTNQWNQGLFSMLAGLLGEGGNFTIDDINSLFA